MSSCGMLPVMLAAAAPRRTVAVYGLIKGPPANTNGQFPRDLWTLARGLSPIRIAHASFDGALSKVNLTWTMGPLLPTYILSGYGTVPLVYPDR